MKRPLLFSVTILMAIIVTRIALNIGGGSYSLVWNSIDSGGEMFSSGGGYELGGTIGQADAGPSSPTPPADSSCFVWVSYNMVCPKFPKNLTIFNRANFCL